MTDEISDKTGSLEERKQATKELFERDITAEVSRKDLEADDVLGTDHLEVAQSDVAMPGSVDEGEGELTENHGVPTHAKDLHHAEITPATNDSETRSFDAGSRNFDETYQIDETAHSSDFTPSHSEMASESRAYALLDESEKPTQASSDKADGVETEPASLTFEQTDIAYQAPAIEQALFIDQEERISTADAVSSEPQTDSSTEEHLLATLIEGSDEDQEALNNQPIGEANDQFEPGTGSSGSSHQETEEINFNDTSSEPVIILETPTTVIESVAETVSQLTPIERDSVEIVTYAIAGDEEAPAGFVLNQDGSYSFDSTHEAYQHLGVGDSQIITVPVVITNDQGLSRTSEIQITVTGTNDAPVATAEEVSADEGSLITGQLQASDVDLAEGSSLVFSTDADIEGLTLNADGSYSFDASGYEELSEGETQAFEIPVTVTDDQGATAQTTLTITVTGSNDAPAAVAEEVSTDEGSVVTGQLHASDVDLAEGSVLVFSTDAEVEGLTLNEDGSYNFDASSYEELSAGETQTLEIPVTVTDDQGATAQTTLTVTVTGTNDLPIAVAEEVSADEGALITGQLQASDVDLAEGSALVFSTDAEVEGLTLNADGSYSFDASSYEELSAGETQTLEIPVSVTDDQGATAQTTLTITVTGSNDAPTAVAEEVSTDEGSVVTGQLQASDVDLAEGSVLVFSTDAEVEGLTLNADGSYSFDASGYEELGAGETQTLEIPVTVTDDQGATGQTTLTITVAGSNDAPTAVAEEVSTDEGSVVTGQLQASDADLAEGSVLVFSTDAEVEGLTLNEDGSYSFDASSYEELSAGETQTLEIPVTVTDDQGATGQTTLTITVTGSNDAPAAVAEEVSTDEGSVVTGQLQASDVDLAEGSALVFSTDAEVEGLTLNADGSYSFDASGFEELGAGETQTLEIPVTVTDDQGATAQTTLTVTVTGTNDLPIAVAEEVSADEGALITGQLQASDVDLAEGSVLVFSTDAEVEGLTLNADGSYSFDASGFEVLGTGETHVLEVPVTVTDDQGAKAETTLTINVQGLTNDTGSPAQEGDTQEGSKQENQEEQRGQSDQDDLGEQHARDDREVQEEQHGRGDQEDRDEQHAGNNRDGQKEHHGKSDRDDRGEQHARDDREAQEEQHGRGGQEDRDEQHGQNDLDNQGGQHAGNNREDQQQHRGKSDRDDRGEQQARNDREDQQQVRGKSDRNDRDEQHARDDREDQQQDRGKSDRDDRDEQHARDDRDDQQQDRGKSDRDDRDEQHARNDREDQQQGRGKSDRDDRGEQHVRDDREDQQQDRGKSDRDDRGEQQARDDREDQQQDRGKSDRDDRGEQHARDDREVQHGRGDREGGHDRSSQYGNEDSNDSNTAPTDISVKGGVVEEGSSSGTVVATLSTTDEDSGESFSYDLLRDDSGHFEIVGDQLVVRHGADIDYEESAVHQISIKVTDAAGESYTETIAIQVEDVQEAMDVDHGGFDHSDLLNESELQEDSYEVSFSGEVDDDSGFEVDSEFDDTEPLEHTDRGGDDDGQQHHVRAQSRQNHHSDRGEDGANSFDGADYFEGGSSDGWTDVVQLNPDADPNADPSNPWAISVDGEQVQYDIADHALSVDPEASNAITFSDGSELTIEGIDRIEW